MPEQKHDQPQVDKFRELARQLECDEDEKAFEEKVRKMARSRPPGKWQVLPLKDGGGYYAKLHPSIAAAPENGPVFVTEAEAEAWAAEQDRLRR